MNFVLNVFQVVAPVLNSWALRPPPCPSCTCSCPASSVALTCGGSASTGSITSDFGGSRWSDRVAGLVVGIFVAFAVVSLDWRRVSQRIFGGERPRALPSSSRESSLSGGRRGITGRQ